MPNYQNGRIYLIRGGNEVYYGSTTQPLSVRMAKHRSKYKNNKNKCKSVVLFLKFGVDNCSIELVEAFPCNSREELHAREGHWIRNNPCVNMCIPGRTPAEYYEDNHEKIIERNTKHYEANKPQILERMAKHYEANKAQIKQKYKDMVPTVCVCGGKYKLEKSKHENTKKHKDYIASQNVISPVPSAPQS